MTTNCRTSRWCCSGGLLLLLGMSVPLSAADSAMQQVLQQVPWLDSFAICHGGGCAVVRQVSLTADEWQQVRAVFAPDISDAEAERRYIAAAVGLLEQLVGAKSAIWQDRAGTFGNAAYAGQLDCNDEAANATTYLKLLRQDRLIRFHRIGDTKLRGFFIRGWPHTTASIVDMQSGQSYAVDSWFYDNGQPAVVVPLADWKRGWNPGGSLAR